MSHDMPNLKIEPEGLLIPPQYLDGLGPNPSVRRIKGGLILESRAYVPPLPRTCQPTVRLPPSWTKFGPNVRAIVDTNIFVSGLINPRGAPGVILDAVIEGRATPIFSIETLAELHDVLARPRLQCFL